MSEWPRVAWTRWIFAPRSMAWLAWACLSQWGDTSEAFFRPAFLAVALTILSAWRAVIGLGPPSGPFFWERNSGASGQGEGVQLLEEAHRHEHRPGLRPLYGDLFGARPRWGLARSRAAEEVVP